MLLLAAGCAPGDFDADEALAVYGAMEGVNSDVWAFLYDRSAPSDEDDDTDPIDTGPLDSGWDTAWKDGAAKDVLWHTHADGSGSFEGTYGGLGSWTGQVALVGSYQPTLLTLDEWSQMWDMQATWTDIEYGDMRIDAEFDWDVGAVYDGGAFTYLARVHGDVTSRGGARGEGRVEYLTTVRYTGGQYLVSTEGTIGGRDISHEYDATAFGI